MSSVIYASEPVAGAAHYGYAQSPATTYVQPAAAPTTTYVQPAVAPATTYVQHAAAQPVQYVQQAQPVSYVQQQTLFQPFQMTASTKIDAEMGKKLKAAFRAADKDNSGALTAPELSVVLQSVGLGHLSDPSTLAIKLKEFDTDGSGDVSFEEFMASFHTKPMAPPPKTHEGSVTGGKWRDNVFPASDEEALYKSPNPAADHVSDIRGHAAGGVKWISAAELCGDQAVLFRSVHPNDIAQGILGDCWLLAAMAGVAEFEGAVFNLFQDKQKTADGKYTINIYNPTVGQWDCVTIDDMVPCHKNRGSWEPLMTKPQDHEMWVLLLEKAFAKWFGSYAQIQGAYCMVAFMLLLDCKSPCTVFTQSMNGQPPFNEAVYHEVDARLRDAKNRNSVGLAPKGQLSSTDVWARLKQADASNHVMAAWTSKDPEVATGRGASGEVIASDGIVKGHAYSLISAKEVMRDDNGMMQRVVQLRNPWGANPAAEYKGELADDWAGWAQNPNMKRELLGGAGKLDGMFWMTFENFAKRYSDCGIVPKEMEVYKVGKVNDNSTSGKNARRGAAVYAAAPATYAAAPAVPTPTSTSKKSSKDKKGKTSKKQGCCK